MRTEISINRVIFTESAKTSGPRSFNSVGIVPIIGSEEVRDCYGTIWDPYLLPVGPGHTVVQRAVLECLWAGCRSVWVVCNPDTKPLLKHELGNWTIDPRTNELHSKMVSNIQSRIPIYYVPMDLDCVDRFDTVAWSVLVGARTAYETWGRLSNYHVPDNFYVSFPYCVYNPRFFHDTYLRKRATVNKYNIYLASPDGKTVQDGEPLGFSFRGGNLFKYLERVRQIKDEEYVKLRKEKYGEDDKIELRELLSLKNIFGCVREEKSVVKELPWCYDIKTWQGYCDFLGSKHQKENKKWWRYKIFHQGRNPYSVFEWLGDNEYF